MSFWLSSRWFLQMRSYQDLSKKKPRNFQYQLPENGNPGPSEHGTLGRAVPVNQPSQAVWLSDRDLWLLEAWWCCEDSPHPLCPTLERASVLFLLSQRGQGLDTWHMGSWKSDARWCEVLKGLPTISVGRYLTFIRSPAITACKIAVKDKREMSH